MYYTIRIKKQWFGRAAAGFLTGAVLIAAIWLFFNLGSSFHSTKAANPQVLNFKSVSIQSKDTLWGIAKDYYSEEYGTMNDYIKEIKRCNSLKSDKIRAGSSIIIPIYVVPESNSPKESS